MKRAPETARRHARELAFRVAYQADLTADRYTDVWNALKDEERLSPDQAELVGDVVACLEQRGSEFPLSVEAVRIGRREFSIANKGFVHSPLILQRFGSGQCHL